jgi:hypothetical protein
MMGVFGLQSDPLPSDPFLAPKVKSIKRLLLSVARNTVPSAIELIARLRFLATNEDPSVVELETDCQSIGSAISKEYVSVNSFL